MMYEHEKVMADFNELTSGDIPVLVDFYAVWCGPCRSMAPELEELKKKLGDRIRIVKFDIDNRANIKILQQYRVRSVPTLMIFRNGELLWRDSGARSAAELERRIDEVMSAETQYQTGA